jgi:predicted GTPase
MTNILDSIDDPAVLKKILERIKYTKINVLLIGGTGVGKSSTINALFQNVGNPDSTPGPEI